MLCADIERVNSELDGIGVLRSFIEFKLMAGRKSELVDLFLPDQSGKLKLLEGIFENGQREGKYRTDIKPKTAALRLYEIIFGAYYVAFSNYPAQNPVQSAQDGVRCFFKMLRTG